MQNIDPNNSCCYCLKTEFQDREIYSEMEKIPDGLDRTALRRVKIKSCKECRSVFINELTGDKVYVKGLSTSFTASKETLEKSDYLDPYSSPLVPKAYKKLWVNCDALDFGCGGGYFTRHLSSFVRSVEAADLDKEAVEFVSRTLKIKTHYWDISNIPTGKFNLITLIGVFEHLDKPDQAIGSLSSSLMKGGFLLIALPNLNSFTRYISRFSKHDWDMFLEPGHLSFPSKKIFLKNLKKEGLDLDYYFTTNNIIRGKIPFLPYRDRDLERLVFKFCSKNRVLNYLYYLLFKLFDLFRLGDISVYILKKSN